MFRPSSLKSASSSSRVHSPLGVLQILLHFEAEEVDLRFAAGDKHQGGYD